ncbi:Gfo/Idh/MocA family protein [Ferroacidibacillus organovorans]|uniref:Dehydrogenase n=1 Tax=Ferroacidibacillus organovorans TaxID=1765683 RepID=A0A853KG69_9BACL|nr:Gfo/Idh/MocA family oxidoreductase [Ferroacidibacillus organovorans]KYP82050.1 dehydrogenase [Ferroacidibacillus organovorans]OAG94370.1 dehydrogenase [Ferroacidibacillus organovorans]
MIRVAMMSKWHVHATDYLREANAHPEVEVAAVWDEDPARGRAFAREIGVPFYDSTSSLYREAAIDGVIVDTPTNMHPQIIAEAIQNKKHVFSEKVLALNASDAIHLTDLAHTSGVHLMLSLSRLCAPYTVYAESLLQEEALGRVTSFRCRVAHDGSVPTDEHAQGWLPAHFYDPITCGGGALIDLGAHPIYLSNRLAGPVRALSARLEATLGHEVDDNATVMIEYASGALGLLESSFVSGGSPFLMEIHGTKGSLLIENESARVRFGRGPLVAVNLPPERRSAMTQWVDAILRDTAPEITPDDMIELTRVNELAQQAHREGRRVTR